ncbi:MAG: alkaline phosphatase D family protein, partial [Ramlibacter sp.]
SRPARYVATSGRLWLLPAGIGSSGCWPFVTTVAEALLLLGAAAWIVWALARVAIDQVLLGALVFAMLALASPLSRSLITWWVLRGRQDGKDSSSTRSPWQRLWWGIGLATSMVRQMVHAREKRVMRYRVQLKLDDAGTQGDVPQRLTLLATKRVAYRASIAEVVRHVRAALQGRTIAIRDTFWEQVMDAHVRLVPATRGFGWRTLASGRMRMGFESLAGSGQPGTRGLSGLIGLGKRGDTTSGLLAAAGYPLLFLRFALKTRMLDFRLPAYSGRPVPDTLSGPESLRRDAGQRSEGELRWVEGGERGACGREESAEPNGPLRLPLQRFRLRDAAGQPVACHVQAGSWNGLPVARAKAVLLLHAFGQSGLTFTFQTSPQNLAEHFLARGYEVWVLEMRTSTRSGYGADPSTVDQLGQHDIPRAVDHILDCLRAEHGEGPLKDRPWQIAAFAHCIGSASLWMALLSGRLSHGEPAERSRDARAHLSKISHLVSSQLHPWVVGGRVAQAKTWVPSLLSKAWRHASVPFAVRGAQPGLLETVMDRVLSSLPAPLQETRRAPGITHDDAAATCRRIRYIDAPLFGHANIGAATLGEMNRLFGDANLRLFGHARRFIERRRLVDADGINCYVTDPNIARHLALPIQLLHGEDNQLFDIEGARRTFERLGRHHGGWQRTFCRDRQGRPGFLAVPGHGHLDLLIGERAHTDVFPDVVRFFETAHATVDHDVASTAVAGWSLRAPRVGPFVGFTRQEGDEVVVRVSFMPEDAGLGDEPRVRLRHWRGTAGAGGRFVTWVGEAHWQVEEAPAARMVWGDIRLPAGRPVPEQWQLLVFVRTHSQGEDSADGPDASDQRIDDLIATMDKDDAQQSATPPLVPADNAMHRCCFRLPAATFDSLPAGSNVTFAAATCRHPGLGLDQGRIDDGVRRFLASRQPEQVAFATLLGDQIYADATAGLVDPLSPVERFHERHETAFGRGRLGDLLAALPVYMTPDDHEWIDNYPLASPLVRRSWPTWDDPALPFDADDRDVFDLAAGAVKAFQRLQSPTGAGPADHYAFHHGCVRVFVIDSRMQRQRHQPMVVRDLAALEAWLQRPEARQSLNVVMCGSVVLPGLHPGADPASSGAIDTWQHAPAQRLSLLQLLVQHVPARFLLLSGDYHVSGAAVLTVDGAPMGAAVIAPPLYAPLLYANCSPATVFTGEAIDLGGGRILRMQVPPGGEFVPGSGLGTISVRRRPEGIAITYQRDLWVWEGGAAHQCACDLGLAGGAGTSAASVGRAATAGPG